MAIDPIKEGISRAKAMFSQMLPDEEFNKNFEWECARIEDMYKTLKKGEQSWPELSIVMKDYKMFKDKTREQILMVLGTMPEDSHERRMMFFGAGAKMAEMHPHKYPFQTTFISEAWTRVMSKDKLEDMQKADKRVSDYEDRTESVIVFSMAMDKRTAFASYHIQRNSRGKITGLKQYTKHPYNPEDKNPNESPLVQKFYEGFTMANTKAWLEDHDHGHSHDDDDKPRKVGKES